jgi:hypothetical protein
VELDFAAPYGTQRYTSWSSDLTIGGQTYKGLGHIMAVPAAKGMATPSSDTHTLAISSADLSVLALALGPAYTYVGRRARLYTVFLDGNVPLPTARLYFTGQMEPVSISQDKAPTGVSTGRIELPLRRLGLGRSRNAEGIRLTHAQQQIDYPGDLGLSGLSKMLESQVWYSKEYQRASAG